MTFDTHLKPYRRRALGQFVDSLTFAEASAADQFNRTYLANDNWDYARTDDLTSKPLLNYFFRTAERPVAPTA